MSAPIVSQKTLEERITARLHESIGDLITDEDLKGMVARGIEAALFQPRTVVHFNRGYSSSTTKPSLVEELVGTLLEKRMGEAIDTWLNENPDKITAALEAVMRAGVADALLQTLDNRFQGIFDQVTGRLQARGLL